MRRLLDWLAILTFLGGTLYLLLAAYASVARADCMTPWDSTRWRASPATGSPEAYEWEIGGRIVATTPTPDLVGPCPAGAVRVRAVKGSVRGPWSPVHEPVWCLHVAPGEPLSAYSFDDGAGGGFVPAFEAGWSACARSSS